LHGGIEAATCAHDHHRIGAFHPWLAQRAAGNDVNAESDVQRGLQPLAWQFAITLQRMPVTQEQQRAEPDTPADIRLDTVIPAPRIALI
jgi:hypothetical protein